MRMTEKKNDELFSRKFGPYSLHSLECNVKIKPSFIRLFVFILILLGREFNDHFCIIHTMRNEEHFKNAVRRDVHFIS